MDERVALRRVALLAAHGAFILFVEHLVWDAAMQGRQVYASAKHFAAHQVLWLFVGAAFAYGALIFKARIGGILEAISVVMLTLPLLYHVVSMSDLFG